MALFETMLVILAAQMRLVRVLIGMHLQNERAREKWPRCSQSMN